MYIKINELESITVILTGNQVSWATESGGCELQLELYSKTKENKTNKYWNEVVHMYHRTETKILTEFPNGRRAFFLFLILIYKA